jgi:steroid delta-isomerase-like uncharacterized protein
MATAEQNKQAVRDFFEEVFNKKNLDHVREALADDVVEHQEFPGITPDKDGVIKTFEMMFGSTPDMQAEILDLIATGDRVASRSVIRGTDTGGFMPGMPPTNKPYSMEAIDIIRFNDDGKVAEHWGIQDVMGAMGQLGLLPPPPEG